MLWFHNARLIDPEGGTDAVGTLLLRDGAIVERDGPRPDGARAVECDGKCLAPGIVDMGVQVGEPGAQHKESLRTAGLAAALESRAVITRPFAGEGIRVTVGTPEEDDVFLAALDRATDTPPCSKSPCVENLKPRMISSTSP